MSQVAVVYWSGTGNTKQMADAVAEGITGAGAEAVVMTPRQRRAKRSAPRWRKPRSMRA